MLKCAGGAAAWTKVEKCGLKHLTYTTSPTGNPDSDLGQNVAGCRVAAPASKIEVKPFWARWFSPFLPFLY